MNLKILLIVFLLSNCSYAQTETKNSNYLSINIGNSTPFFGLSYQKSFLFKTSNKLNKHLEAGVGIGVISQILPSLNLHLPLGHSLSFLIGKKNSFFKVGYSGIFGRPQPKYNVDNRYIPSLHLGYRFKSKDSFLGLDINGYLYQKYGTVIKDDNSIYRLIQTKISIYPGLSFGFKI